MNRRATWAAPHEWGFRAFLLEAGLPGAALVARAFMPGRQARGRIVNGNPRPPPAVYLSGRRRPRVVPDMDVLRPAIISGPMIAVSDLSKSFGPQTLFEGVSIQFNPGNRYGLVGANGSGKSTFLRILAGEDVPSEGTIAMPKRLKLGVLKQDHFRYEHMPILEVAMMGNHDVWEAIVEKERLLANAEQELGSDRYADLEAPILLHDCH